MLKRYFVFLTNGLLNGVGQSREAGFHVFAKMHAKGSAAAFGENREVAASLCGFHDAESVFLAGNREIDGVIASDLEKYAAVRSTFVGLSGGVQEARAESEDGGDFFGVANPVTDAL